MEDGYIYKFLADLNVEFDEVRGGILGKTNLPTITIKCVGNNRQNVMSRKKLIDSIESSALVVKATTYKASDQSNKTHEMPRV